MKREIEKLTDNWYVVSQIRW